MMADGKRIKVLHIITRLDPGGSSTNTLETVARLDPAVYDVHLVAGRTTDPFGVARAFIQRHDIDCRYVQSLVREVRPLQDAVAFFTLWRIMCEGKYDLVHTHTSKAGVLGRWAAHAAGVKKIVHTPHGHIFYGYFSGFVTKIYLGLERWSSTITTRLIALTPKGIQEHLALGVGVAGQWVSIPSGIDTEVFKLAINARGPYRQLLGLEDQDIVLVCAARLEPVKNHRVLIDLVAGLRAEFPMIKLVLLGDGPQRAMLVQHAREAGVAGHVVFAGFRQDVALVFSACDFFVMASLNEGMGRSVLEAMSVGLPVVVGRAGGLPAIVNDGVNGFLVPPTEVDAWVRAVKRLLMDPALRLRFSREAKKGVHDAYSVTHMVRQIEQVYAGLFV
ncbi:MAG: glycosyltransferase family 4 protein [Candidatus Omnitrophota bacterium]